MLVKAMSKLYLAGEYSVLVPFNIALIVPVEKYTYVDIKENDTMQIFSDIEDKDNLIIQAVNVARDYAKTDKNFILNYKTDLYLNNIKLGLGSSASVVCVTIKAILRYLNIQYTKDTLFLLCVKAMKNKNGSMGDLACICYESLIEYHSIDKKNNKYYVRIVKPKNKLKINAIWTRNQASTQKQIENIHNYYNTPEFIDFCEKSNKYTKLLIESIETSNIKKLEESIKNLNDNLYFLEKISNIQIYSDSIKQIMKNNKNSKVSGAGLGDFVISLEILDELEGYTINFEV